MPSKNIGDLAVKITADTAKFTKSLDKAKRDTDSFATKLKRGFASAAKGAAMLTAGFAAVGGAISLAVKSALDYADTIGKAADQSGMATTTIQEMRYALGFFNISAQESDKALGVLNRRIGKAIDEGGPAAKTFEQMGISLKQLKTLSSDEILDLVIKELGSYSNAAQRAARASFLFGDEVSGKLANAMSKGSAAIENLREEAHELGLVLDDEVIRQAEEVNDELDRMSQIMRMQLLKAVGEVMPEIRAFVKTIVDNKDGIVDTGRALVDIAKAIASVTMEAIEFGRQFGFISDTAEAEIARIEKILEDGVSWDEGLRFFGKNGWVEYWSEDELKARLAELKEKIKKETSDADEPITITITGGREEPPKKAPDMLSNADRKRAAQAAERAARAVERELAAQKKLAEEWKDKLDPTREYMRELDKLDQLWLEGHLSLDEYSEAQNILMKEMTENNKELEKSKELAAEFGDIMVSAFEDAILAGDDFGSILEGLAEDILRLMLRTHVTNPLAEAMGGFDFGSIFSSIGSFFGFAGGGRVHPGMGAITVGERGPELFIPDSPGTIVPNGAIGSYGGGQAPVNIEIINQGTAQTVTHQQQTQDARGMVVQLMLDDLNSGGKISQNYQRAFNLKRGSN